MANKVKPVAELLREKKIYQITNPRLVVVGSDISLKLAIEIMQEHKAGYIVVAENKLVVGIFTETDVVKKILGKKVDLTRPLRDFMTANPFALTYNDMVGSAIDLMATKNFYHIPLVDEMNRELRGVLSVRSLIRFLAEFYPTEVYNLPPRPDQIMSTPEGG